MAKPKLIQLSRAALAFNQGLAPHLAKLCKVSEEELLKLQDFIYGKI